MPYQVCVGCGDTDDQARLEPCPICRSNFCGDCAVRSVGRRFCSDVCARNYYFIGDPDDEDAVDD